MKQKLKSKRSGKQLFKKISYFLFGITVFSVSIAFFPLNSALADGTCSQAFTSTTPQLCDFSQIQLSTQIKINGQNGNSTTAGQQDGNFSLEVVVTLVSPPTLTFGSTQINVAGQNFYLVGAGITSTPTNTSKVCGNPSLGTTGGSFTYFNCSNPPFDETTTGIGSGLSSLNGQTKKAGDVILDYTYAVDHSNFSALGINQLISGTDLTTGINQFYIYTGLGAATSGNSAIYNTPGFKPFYNTYSPGQSVYVQLYPTQVQATAAAASGQQPPACTAGQTTGCVPGYGTNTSTGANPGPAPNGLITLINNIISFILSIVQELAFALFYYLVSPLIEAMLKVQPYTDSFVAVIYPGWIIIRNLCNIFFIIALIIIAMATLFRVESYQYKHLLVQLLIAALLINFSLVIAQAILGLASTVQAQFLGDPNNITQIRVLGQALMNNNNNTFLQSVFSNSSSPFATTAGINATATNGSFFAGIIQSIFWLALSLGTLCVFIAIMAYLFIRIVALWVLLMISPIAYACGVLPSTASYRSMWWQNFLKYAFFTPIMAFFLNLTAVMVSNAQHNPVFTQILNNTSPLTSGGGAVTNGFAAFIVSVGSDILLLVFLLAGLKVAEQASIFGASTITGLAEKGIYAPFAYAGKGIKGIAGRSFEGVQNVSGITLDPREWSAAWKKYSEEQKAKRKDIRAGKTTLGLNLGSPQDMFKNYGNIAAAKRLGRNLISKGKLKDLSGQYEKNVLLEKALSDGDKASALASLSAETQGKDLMSDEIMPHLNAGELNRARAAEVLSKVRDEQARLNSEHAAMAAARARLVAAGQSTADVDAKITANRTKEANLDSAADILDTQLSDPANEYIALGDSSSLMGDVFSLDAEKASVLKGIETSDKNISNLQKKINSDNDTRAKLHAIDSSITATSGISGAMKTTAKNAVNDFRNLAAQHQAPQAYYAREARLHLEAEESKKIADIKDEGELNALLADAINQKDQHKATAILKKLTKDVNLNEVLEDNGKETSFQGFKDYMVKDFGEKLGVDHHELMQIATELGYLAEETSQYNFARPTSVNPKTQHLEWQEQGRHDDHVITEMKKSDPRNAAGRIGRFSVVDEHDEGGIRVRTLNRVGAAHLLRFANPILQKNMNQFNTYTLQAAVEDPKWRQTLINNAPEFGAKPEDVKSLISEIERIMGSKAS